MTTKTTKTRCTALLTAATAILSLSAVAGCHATSHAVGPAAIGVPRSTADLEALADVPGPITVETVVGTDWEVDRGGRGGVAGGAGDGGVYGGRGRVGRGRLIG